MKRKDTGKPARPAGDFADPYKKARRPRPAGGDSPPMARRPRPKGEDAPPYVRRARPSGEQAPPYARERRPPRREPGEGGFGSRERGGRDGGAREGGGREGGFTVHLDPDVARVFRGDASVNKALRLVMQLMQVVQGPPARGFGSGPGRPEGERPRRGYQGSSEARGFTRKPRFDEDDGQ